MTRRHGLSRGLSQAPPSLPLTRAIGEAGGGGALTPSRLFRSGEKGLALDLTDMSKLYQDIARTTLVTATGQPIGSPSDISGNAAHPTPVGGLDANRPTYQGYAVFDATNDGWISPTIDFTGTDEVTVVVGLRKLSDAANGSVVELSASATNNGIFNLYAPGSGGTTRFQGASKGTTAVIPFTASATYNAPITAVVSLRAKVSTPSAILRVNGTQVASIATTQGTGNYGNYPIYIGRSSGSQFFNGWMYRLIVIGRRISDAELLEAEAWCGGPFS